VNQLRFLLDTDTVIHFLKGRGQIAQRLLQIPPSELALSTISLYELYVGVVRSSQPERTKAQLDALLEWITIVPFDEDASRAAAEVRGYLERSGRVIGTLDTLIAGVAIARNLVLVTHNLSEFQRVPYLQVEDWF